MYYSNDTIISWLSSTIVLMRDTEVGQWILAKVSHRARGLEFTKFAFWRDGLDKLPREISRRQSYKRLDVPEEVIASTVTDPDLLSLET